MSKWAICIYLDIWLGFKVKRVPMPNSMYLAARERHDCHDFIPESEGSCSKAGKYEICDG